MKKGISLFYILTLLLLVAQSSLFAGASLEVTPHDVKVQAGSEFTVSINLDSDTSIMSLMAILQWDDSVIEPVEYIVPTEFDDPDNISTGWIEDSTMAIIGVAKMFANAIVAPYNGTIAQIKFKAKADAEVGDSTLVYLSLDSDLYQAADIGVQTVDMDPVQTTLTDGEVTIVKLFNVAIDENEVDYDEQDSVASDAAVFTNETGAEYTAGGTLDSTLTVELADGEYDAAKHGSFSVSGNTIVWNPGTFDRAAVGHGSLTFNVSYSATSADDNAYTASGVYTLVVNPVNQAPVVSGLTVIAATEGAPFSFSVTVVDPEGDAFTLPEELDAVVGGVENNLKGAWTSNGDTYTFTTTDNTPYDAVSHTASDDNVLSGGCYYASWSISLVATDEYEADSDAFEAASTAGDYTTWIKDVDQAQSQPAITGITPAAPTTSDDITVTFTSGEDEDGDEITPVITWSNDQDNTTYTGETLPSSMTAKGQTWTPALVTTTTPYGTDTVEVAADEVEGVTIQNTAPALAGDKTTMVVVKPTEATEAKPSKSLAFTVTDPDNETFSSDSLVITTAPTNGTVAGAFDGTTLTLTYTVNDAALEEFSETFAFAVKDGDEAQSDAITVTVQYLAHQEPEMALTGPEAAIDEVVADTAEAAMNGEGEAATFEVSVTATDLNEEGETGIASIEWTLPDGWSYEVVSDTGEGIARTVVISVTTAGYETLAGAERAASDDFEIKATATDATGVTSDETITVTINDVDRVATAPTTLGLSGADLYTGSTVSATPAGSTDADGDVVSYKVTLSVDGAALESDVAIAEGDTYTSTETVKKGQVPNVKAVAVSKAPYAAEDAEGGELAADLEAVKNSAPVITTPTENVKVTIEEYVEGYNEASIALAIGEGEEAPVRFAYTDIDEEAEVDNVTVEVDGDGLEGYATITIEDAVVTITREPNVNTVGLDTLPTFTITATDESGESVEVVISLEITPVNTKPVVEQADIYVLPSDIDGTEKAVTYQMVRMGESDDEDNTQKIAAVNLVSCNWEGFLTAAPSFEIAEDGKSFDVKFTMDENAAAGTELEMVIAVQDDGGQPFEDTSDEVTIKFILGSTPWYPIYETDCEDGHDAHQLVITSADGKTTTLIVEGEELRPADYYAQGCKGLESGDYTLVAYAWTVADGAADEPCYEGGFSVPEYDVPGLANVSYNNANSTITVNAPLASSYVLTIYKDGEVLKTITKDFIPNDEGLIVPTETFEYVFADAGTYTATIHGVNPKGNGPESDETELIVIEDGEEVELAWPEDGVFTPEGVIYLTEGAKSANVSFSWPIVDAAEKYILVILNSAAGLNFETTVTANTYTKNLSLSGGKGNFNWYVIAVDADGNELSSDAMDFSLVQKTNKVVVEGISVENDGDDTVIFNLVGFDAEKTKKVDIQIAHIVDKQVTWYYAIKSQGGAADLNVADDGTVTATINGATISKGDIAVIRFYYEGGSVDKYTTYTVK